jgi:hypothetical protein
VPEVVFEDLLFDLSIHGQTHAVIFDEILVNRSIFKNRIAYSEISAKGHLDGAPLLVEATVRYEPEGAQLALEIELTGLNTDNYQYLLPETVGDLNALADLDITVALDRAADGHLTLEDAAAIARLREFGYQDARFELAFDAWHLEATDIDFSLDASQRLSTKAMFSTKLSGLGAQARESGDELFFLKELTLSPAELDYEDGALSLTSAALDLNGLRGSRVNAENLRRRLRATLEGVAGGKQVVTDESMGIPDELPPMLSLDRISFDSLALGPNGLSIDTLSLGAGEVEILLADNGALATLTDTAALAGDKAAVTASPAGHDSADAPAQASGNSGEGAEAMAEATSEVAADEPVVTPAENAFFIKLQKLNLEEALTVNFVDESQQPKFRKKLFISKALVQGLDSSDLEKSANFELSVNDGQYFSLDIRGDAQPFKETVNANINAEVHEFSLPDISSYLARYLDFEIKAGQLDTEFQGSIVNSEIDADAKVKIRAADFSASKVEAEEANLIGQAAIPLNVALGMLKDSKGNIELRIPVDGSLDDPNFGMQYIMGLVIQKAVMSQAKNYLINAFVPYAQVVSVAMVAGSYALKVRFEDLPYEPGQIAPEPQQQVFIDQLSKLMNDKPDLQVKVCPVATPADLIALQAGADQAASATSADTPSVGAEAVQRYGPLTEDQKILINELSSQRAASFKEAVILQGGIESSRLLLCSPEVDFKVDGQTRMKFSV